MRRNFDLSTVLTAIGAGAVVIALFLDWYDPGLSAWDAFEVIDWALLALALGAVALLAGETAGALAPGSRLAWVGAAIGVLVLAALLDPPPAAADAEREIGAWLALAGAVLIGAGIVLALLRISVTIDVSDRERRRRTAAVDARDAADDDGHDVVVGDPATEGLWKRPGDTEPNPQVEPEGESREGSGAVPASDDPDRTQPLRPTSRPDAGG